MQYPTDDALAEAVYSNLRAIRGLLEIDWNRNNLYDHPYADLSPVLKEITGDRSITGDLPEQVSTLVGYASGELTVTLGGKRRSEEPNMINLFSEWNTSSPVYGKQTIGTPIRYSRVVYTNEGRKTVRQFTGWIREMELSRDDDTVKLTISDVLDIQGRLSTLPHWAIVNPELNWSPSRPMKLTWVVEELLRQGGRPVGPQPRPDCAAFFSCNGAFLPAFGYGHLADGYQEPYYKHGITRANPNPFAPGKYGWAPVLNNQTQSRMYSNYVVCNLNRILQTPERGSTETPITIGVAGWYYSDGSGDHSDTDLTSSCMVYLDRTQGVSYAIDWTSGSSYEPGGGAMNVRVYKDGMVEIIVAEDFSFAATDTRNLWQVATGGPQPQGWHYIDTRINFAPNSVTMTVRVDDVLQGLQTLVTPGAVGFRHRTRLVGGRDENAMFLTANIPCQYIQVYGNATATMLPYDPNMKFPQMNAEGLPFAVIHDQALAELTYIPDVSNESVWDVLQEVCLSDFAVLHTDEYGTIHYVPHYNVRNDWKADYNSGITTTISDEKLLGFVVNPTYDGYKNSINLKYAVRSATLDIVWNNPDPDSTMGLSGRLLQRWIPLEDVIAVRTIGVLPKLDSNTPPQSPPMGGGSAGVYWDANSQTNDWQTVVDNGLYGAGCYHVADQRQFRLDENVSSLPSPWDGVRFTFKGGSQGGIYVPGLRYGESKEGELTVQDSSQIALKGLRALDLDDHEWRQGQASAQAIGESILEDTLTPAPVVQNISIPCDPRLQLRDVVEMRSEGGITGKLIGQIIGKTISDNLTDGFKDILNIRLLKEPGSWILGDPELSILGETTIL